MAVIVKIIFEQSRTDSCAPQSAILSNQFSLTYADVQDDDLAWDNRIFVNISFFANNNFNYGLYTGGYYNNNDTRA